MTKQRKISLIITAICIVAGIIAAVILLTTKGGGFGGGSFNLSNTQKIQIGDSKSKVIDYIGPADEKYDYRFEYYGQNYRSVVEEQEKLAQQMENISSMEELEKLLEKELKLEQQLATMKYAYLIVDFDQNGVTSVVYDAVKCESGSSANKQSKEVKLSETGVLLYTNKSKINITAAITYTDDSYKLTEVPASAFEQADSAKTETQTLTWEDDWGSYSAQFAFMREYFLKSDVGFNNVNYTFTIENGDTADNYSIILNISGNGSIGYYNETSDTFNRYGYHVKKIIMGKDVACYTSTFYQCFPNVESVVMENGTKTVGNGTFSGCGKLKSIEIPASVNEFCSQSFSECPSLTDITYGGTKAQWAAISKHINENDERGTWNYGTNNCTVHCTDGDVALN